MPKIVVLMSVSVDGYLSDPDGGLDWQTVDAELHQHFNDVLAPAGAFLGGRVTYEMMAAFWPTADSDPESGPEMAQFARIWRGMPQVVYSTTLTEVAGNTTLRREVVVDEVRALQQQARGDLFVGGGNLAATFRAHDLVDEYRLYVHPVVLGRGVPLFAGGPGHELALLDTRAFTSGVVLLHYARAR